MNAHFLPSRTAVLAAGALLVLAGIARAAADADAMPVFDENYVKVIGVAPFSNGSSAAFNRRMQYSHDGAGGIADFRYFQEVSKESNYEVNGRLLPGAGDYLGTIKFVKNEVGSVEAGYRRFRTFYDGVGGFFPNNNAWIGLYPRERYVDRAKFFVNATLEQPKLPVFTFRYANELRTGTKDSTIWGDTDFTGIPIWSQAALNPITATRKLLPAYLQLDERQQSWELSARHTVGGTTASLSVIRSEIDNLDARSIDRFVFELKPFPAIPSTPATLVPPNLANNPNRGSDIQGFEERALTFLGKIETKLSERHTVYAETLYRHANADHTGSRLIVARAPTPLGVREGIGLYSTGGRPPYSYTSTGRVKSDIYTGVAGLRSALTKDLHVDLAVRAEDARIKASSVAHYIATQLFVSTATLVPVPVTAANANDIREKPWTPAVDVRYTGIKQLALYGSWDYRTMAQDERSSYAGYTVNTTTGVLSAPVALAADHITERHANVKLGANWTPNATFNLRPEFFSKDHENRFDGYGVSAGSYYVLDYAIYGARVTAIVKPLPALSFNTRYIVQRGKAAMIDDALDLKGDSNDSRRTQICETIDWAPNKNVYVQGSVNFVYDTVRTANPRVTGLARAVVANSDNNYWNGSLVTTFVLTKRTDASIQGTVYRAKNYNPALATYTQPFGAGGREYTATVGVKHKFSARVVGSAKVGYFDSQNATTGGNTDFHGPLAYLAMERAF